MKYIVYIVALTFFYGCANKSANEKALIGKWHYASYSWKYFDNEMSSLNAHLAAAPDSATKTIYTDSIALLKGIEEDTKMITFEFDKDGSFFMAYTPAEGKAEAGKGTWKLVNDKKLIITPYYPDGDSLTIASLNKDSLVLTGIDRAQPFKVVCKAATK